MSVAHRSLHVRFMPVSQDDCRLKHAHIADSTQRRKQHTQGHDRVRVGGVPVARRFHVGFAVSCDLRDAQVRDAQVCVCVLNAEYEQP